MFEKKNYKSVYIHNGCRTSKVKPVRFLPKISLFRSIVKVVSQKIIYLMDVNMSMKDAETQKTALYGKWYLETSEHAFANFYIVLNNIRINVNTQLLNLFIKLAKKLNVYD